MRGLGIRVNTSSLQGLNKAIKNISGIAGNAARVMGQAFYKEVDVAISLDDHSLEDLADLDHPYARRHGSIRIHGGKPVVHEQSGDLRESLWVRPLNQYVAEVGFDEDEAEHAPYVVMGTKTMIQRDVLGYVASDRRVGKAIAEAAATVVRQNLMRGRGR